MAELVAELIGELGPTERTNIDDDPGGVRVFVVQPDVRQPGCVLVDPQFRRLRIGQLPHPGQAGLAHPRDHAKASLRGEPPHSPPSSNGADSNVIGGDRGCARASLIKFGRHRITAPLCHRKVRRFILPIPARRMFCSLPQISLSAATGHRTTVRFDDRDPATSLSRRDRWSALPNNRGSRSWPSAARHRNRPSPSSTPPPPGEAERSCSRMY